MFAWWREARWSIGWVDVRASVILLFLFLLRHQASKQACGSFTHSRRQAARELSPHVVGLLINHRLSRWAAVLLPPPQPWADVSTSSSHSFTLPSAMQRQP